MVNSGLHGERGQKIAGDQHVALGGELNVSGQRRRGMSRRCRSLGPQPGYDQIRPVGRSHPPDEPRMRGIPLGAGTERRPVGDEVNVRLAARGSREGDKRPLGVQHHVKQQVTPRPATTAGRPRQLIVIQLFHVIGDGLVGRRQSHVSTAGLDMAHPATIDDPSPGPAGLEHVALCHRVSRFRVSIPTTEFPDDPLRGSPGCDPATAATPYLGADQA